MIVNDRVLVPMRAVFEALGCGVEWNGETKTVTASNGDDTIILKIDDDTMLKNDEKITLDAPAELDGDFTMVPLRAVSEALDRAVSWDGETRTVTIE